MDLKKIDWELRFSSSQQLSKLIKHASDSINVLKPKHIQLTSERERFNKTKRSLENEVKQLSSSIEKYGNDYERVKAEYLQCFNDIEMFAYSDESVEIKEKIQELTKEKSDSLKMIPILESKIAHNFTESERILEVLRRHQNDKKNYQSEMAMKCLNYYKEIEVSYLDTSDLYSRLVVMEFAQLNLRKQRVFNHAELIFVKSIDLNEWKLVKFYESMPYEKFKKVGVPILMSEDGLATSKYSLFDVSENRLQVIEKLSNKR